MMSHTHQEGVKRFITHIMRLSGESRVAPEQSKNWLERGQGNETGLGVFGG